MSDTVTDRLAELENKKAAIEEAIETERLKQKFVEDENSIKKYFEMYAKADFEDEDIRNRVLEYFVDKTQISEYLNLGTPEPPLIPVTLGR